MKRLMASAAALLMLATAVHAQEYNTLTAAEREAGWQLLFDGTSMDGWRAYNQDALDGGWSAQDGMLTRTGPGGDIITEAEATNGRVVFKIKGEVLVQILVLGRYSPTWPVNSFRVGMSYWLSIKARFRAVSRSKSPALICWLRKVSNSENPAIV